MKKIVLIFSLILIGLGVWICSFVMETNYKISQERKCEMCQIKRSTHFNWPLKSSNGNMISKTYNLCEDCYKEYGVSGDSMPTVTLD